MYGPLSGSKENQHPPSWRRSVCHGSDDGMGRETSVWSCSLWDCLTEVGITSCINIESSEGWVYIQSGPGKVLASKKSLQEEAMSGPCPVPDTTGFKWCKPVADGSTTAKCSSEVGRACRKMYLRKGRKYQQI